MPLRKSQSMSPQRLVTNQAWMRTTLCTAEVTYSRSCSAPSANTVRHLPDICLAAVHHTCTHTQLLSATASTQMPPHMQRTQHTQQLSRCALLHSSAGAWAMYHTGAHIDAVREHTFASTRVLPHMQRTHHTQQLRRCALL